jgi:hypothetical protein
MDGVSIPIMSLHGIYTKIFYFWFAISVDEAKTSKPTKNILLLLLLLLL